MNKELEPLFLKACLLQQEGLLPQALSLFEQILHEKPTDEGSLHHLGLLYAQLNDLEKAIDYLLRALEQNPNQVSILNNLANAYKKTGNYDKAIAHYQQALGLQPDYAQAHNNLAALYARQNDYANALKHYSQAVNAEPDYTAAHFNLGLLFMQNHELTGAKTQFNNVITLNPQHGKAHFYLGTIYLEENLLNEAEQAFQTVLQCNAEHTSALTNLGVIALKKEQGQLAIDYFTKALAFNNEDWEARNNLAATFMHYDRFENALMHYDVLLKTDPDNPEYLYNTAVAQMTLGHLDEAIVLFERLLQLQPDQSAALNNLAAIYLKREQRETAREYLTQALFHNPQDSISHHMLNALTGTINAPAAPDYVHNLFNNYALYYEKHLQDTLHYSLPHQLSRILHQLSIIKVNKTLDLGCGTGLSGIVLREISAQLDGVDIAEKMLAQAKEKAIYDHLTQAEILTFLHTVCEGYDLITAIDVLPYFGDLQALFSALYAHLNPKGYLIFTTEISTGLPWQLETSARFSHHLDYIKQLAKTNNLQIIQENKIPARLQNHQFLEVNLYVMHRT